MLWVLVLGTLLAPLFIALLLTIGGKVLIVTLLILGFLAVLSFSAQFIKGATKP